MEISTEGAAVSHLTGAGLKGADLGLSLDVAPCTEFGSKHTSYTE